jgi:hypothetical protein
LTDSQGVQRPNPSNGFPRVGKVQEGLNISPKRGAMADLVSISGHGGTGVVAAEGNESDEGQVKLDVVIPNPSGSKRSTNGKITLGILLRVSCAPLLPSPWYASTSILPHRPGFPDRDLDSGSGLAAAPAGQKPEICMERDWTVALTRTRPDAISAASAGKDEGGQASGQDDGSEYRHLWPGAPHLARIAILSSTPFQLGAFRENQNMTIRLNIMQMVP